MTLWQSVRRFQKEKISPWIALRNTVGVALPLAAGIALGNIPAALLVAIGALNVSYSDSHDPYIQRARRMLAASGLVATAVFAGAVCGNHHLLAVPVAGAWAFAAGMLVALSTTAADLGIMSLVTLVVFAAKPLPPESAALSGLLTLGGGLLQTGLALMFWPIRRYVPERRALAALYAELARAAVAPVTVREAPSASAQSTQARTALVSLIGDHSIEGDRYRVLLSQAERTRLALFATGRLRVRLARDADAAPDSDLLERYLEIASRVLEAVAAALQSPGTAGNVAAQLEELQTLADELRARFEEEPGARAAMLQDARVQMDAVTGQLRSAYELSASATAAGLTEFARAEVHRPWQLRLGGTLATLRANLSLRSAACRHAIRLAGCVALGDALGRGFELQRSYWLPMTVAIVLKPDFAATFSRGLLRLAGTFAGLVFATALFHVLPASAIWQVAAITALMFVLRCWGPANYGIFVTAVTGMIVLLIAMVGAPPKEVMAARGLNTAIGGAIALLAYWLWPTRERGRVQDDLAQVLDAYRDYFRVIRESYVHPDASYEEGLDRTRAEARRARSNLEASVDRLSGEPGTTLQTMAALNGVLATSHRLIHAIMALEAGLRGSPPAPARRAFGKFANDVEMTLHSLAAALRGSRLTRGELPDLREDHHALLHSEESLTERYRLVNMETDRITNSLNTLTEELLKWLAD